MRASRISPKFIPRGGQGSELKNKNNSKLRRTLASGESLRRPNPEHISGAEGIYSESEIPEVCGEYIRRALSHPRGMPDEIVITIEKIRQRLKKVPLLPVTTLKCNSPVEAEKIISTALTGLEVSEKAVATGLKVLRAPMVMRGASLITVRTGVRTEPDRKRGVRVSRLGVEKNSEKKLSEMLSKENINTATVKEALILASKVASCPDIIAEVCISDDPDYTTGYVASRKLGYQRIPHIKRQGERHGGRVFFVREDADIKMVIDYLERKPVILMLGD